MSAQYDLAIIGSGFAGSLMAMVARRLGLSVLLLDRGRHPRVVIGESSTPLSNLLLESLADRYNLPMLRPLTKWGSWQEKYPQIGCGLKRGFSFLHHSLDHPNKPFAMRDRQLFVGASPNDRIADTHWYRADVDQLFVHQAQELGVVYVDEFALEAPVRDDQGWILAGTRSLRALTFCATFILDASGPRGYLHQGLMLDEVAMPECPNTSALYCHFNGVEKLAHSTGDPFAQAPYPVDSAAVHHIFNGGWIWVLRFNNGATSAGVAATQSVSDRFDLSAGEAGWQRLLAALPQVGKQFERASAQMPFRFLSRLPFQSASIAGPGWALLPSAAGFVDPLLSTGFSLTLLGVTRLAELLQRDWKTARFANSLQQYARQTAAEIFATARMVGGLYHAMHDFSTFRALSLLYFAAASYTETVRRLDKPELGSAFLLHDHPVFGPGSRRLLTRAGSRLQPDEALALQEEVYTLISSFDVAGLSARPPDHCYPVRAQDLLASDHKLGVDSATIERMLERSGFYASAT